MPKKSVGAAIAACKSGPWWLEKITKNCLLSELDKNFESYFTKKVED